MFAPVAGWAQDVREPVLSNYIGLEIGTGKVNLTCTGSAFCSRVDTSGVIRFGHRFDPSWAVELTYAHIDADWGWFSSNKSAQLTGYGIGAAYSLPVSDSAAFVARAGALSNHLKFQPESGLLDDLPAKVSTRSFKPYLGLAGSWQFARRWSLNVSADWTRASLREAANGAKSDVTVRLLNAGVGFHF
jgi:Outer membrane protein beta-barrel domain